jgi:hypothetical protein
MVMFHGTELRLWLPERDRAILFRHVAALCTSLCASLALHGARLSAVAAMRACSVARVQLPFHPSHGTPLRSVGHPQEPLNGEAITAGPAASVNLLL